MTRVLTSVRVQHLVLTGTGVQPTVPDPISATPADSQWKETDILTGEWAYNQTDKKWYFRDNDIIYGWNPASAAEDWSAVWQFAKLTYLAAHVATADLEITIDNSNAQPNGGVFAQITLDGTQSLTFRGDGIAYTLGGDMTENGETLAAGTYTVVALWGNDAVSISVALVNESGTLALANRAPVASSVTISGTVAVGQTLTGSYTFTDEDGDSESGSTFVWQRSDNGTSGWANISGATATTYAVQSADEGKYLRFGVTPSDGTDAGTQAFSAATIQVPDATAPTLSNVSVSDVTGTTANFNAQINEAGTIFWAVFPTATAQQSAAVIEAGTGAVDFGSIATAGSTTETDGITGLSDETAYKVHYFAEDSAGNASAVAITSEFSTGDITAPTLVSMTIENATPNQADAVFDEATTITTAGWSMSATGGAVTIDSVVSGSGTTTPKLGLSRSIANGETVTVSYNPATGATTDANGNELAEITEGDPFAVTNNVEASVSLEDVVWEDLVNTQVENTDELHKSGGSDGSFDAGATSTKGISDIGDYFQFVMETKAGVADNRFAVGISNDDPGVAINNNDFLIAFVGTFSILENNSSKVTTRAYNAGDIFKIAIEDDGSGGKKIVYYRNDSLAYTSLNAPTTPLKVYAHMRDDNSYIKSPKLYGAS